MRIAGVDPGSVVIATAICDEHGDLLTSMLAELPPKQAKGTRALSRLVPLIHVFEQQMMECAPDYCYIEEPIYAGSFPATIAMGMIVGAIVLTLDTLGIPYSFVGNSVWKKVLIGRGKSAIKDEIRMWVCTRFGVASDLRQDLYDAMAIAEWGRKNFSKEGVS